MRDDLEAILEALRRLDILIDQTMQANRGFPKSGVIMDLGALSKRLRRALALSDDRPRKVGVFGPPKRGKSTLLNVLLGADILPTARTPKTRCIVEIHNIAETTEKHRLVLHKENGGQKMLFKAEADEINNAIDQCFDDKNSDVTRIEVYRDFRSPLFPDNSILVDTPGAESAFEEFSHDEGMGTRGKELSLDTKRALETLDDIDVVFFCMRADQLGSGTEKEFYQRYMKGRKPINIVNLKDLVNNSGEVSDEEIIQEAAENYGLALRDTVVVSALEGMDALKNGKPVPSVSGFQELAGEIRERLNLLEPPEALENAVIEYNTTMDKHGDLNAPLRVAVKRFTEVLKNFAEADRVRQTIERSQWHRDMFD
jgi:tRNA U34 5-carboxymethylaminomethyl modifying GTPase MnmE/TrmE